MTQTGVPEEQTWAESENFQHGFPEDKIYEHFEKFENETKAERGDKSYGTFNEEILKAKRNPRLGSYVREYLLETLSLKMRLEEKHEYLLAQSDEFIVIVPFGPIQSVVHLLAIPKIPIYNVVSLGMENALLVQKMQAALRKVVTDVLTPDSIPQRIYLRALNQAIDMDAKDHRSIRITQK
eukprot:TRINITY_DN5970_c0_g1_i1.p1 TRINITY_DN5970_c0_g1~~TRINITY_DN5970_c0_g1_i1.p1  ORF type:complete len:181 (-),score=23.39 TRINITY_DN5970_c0_g1_i1:72-614(-)